MFPARALKYYKFLLLSHFTTSFVIGCTKLTYPEQTIDDKRWTNYNYEYKDKRTQQSTFNNGFWAIRITIFNCADLITLNNQLSTVSRVSNVTNSATPLPPLAEFVMWQTLLLPPLTWYCKCPYPCSRRAVSLPVVVSTHCMHVLRSAALWWRHPQRQLAFYLAPGWCSGVGFVKFELLKISRSSFGGEKNHIFFDVWMLFLKKRLEPTHLS